MAKKRSKKVQELVDKVNGILALESIYLSNRDRSGFELVNSDRYEAQCYKDGICDVIETALHADGSYRGFMYLFPENSDVRRFDRKYF